MRIKCFHICKTSHSAWHIIIVINYHEEKPEEENAINTASGFLYRGSMESFLTILTHQTKGSKSDSQIIHIMLKVLFMPPGKSAALCFLEVCFP